MDGSNHNSDETDEEIEDKIAVNMIRDRSLSSRIEDSDRSSRQTGTGSKQLHNPSVIRSEISTYSGSSNKSVNPPNSLPTNELVWCELQELKSRIDNLEMATQGSPSRDQNAPKSSSMSSNTLTSSYSETNNSPSSRMTISTSSSIAQLSSYPLLEAALKQAKESITADIFAPLSSTVSETEAIVGLIQATDEFAKMKVDNLCRSLTELCLALSQERENGLTYRGRNSSKDPERQFSRDESREYWSSRTAASVDQAKLETAEEYKANRREARQSLPALTTREWSRMQQPPSFHHYHARGLSRTESRLSSRSNELMHSDDTDVRGPSRRFTLGYDNSQYTHLFTRRALSRSIMRDEDDEEDQLDENYQQTLKPHAPALRHPVLSRRNSRLAIMSSPPALPRGAGL